MHNSVLVSICVPVYNVERYIEKGLRSFFSQTYPNIEYVFINDCTPDNSIGILKDILSEYPIRKDAVKIINHEKNKGLAAARNTGIKNATGEFILWVDSDDCIDIETVEKLVEKQASVDADIVCYNIKAIFKDHEVVYENGDYSNGRDLAKLMIEEKAPHQLCGHLIRRSLYEDNSIEAMEGVNQAEDYQVMPRLAYYAKRVVTLHEALYFYDRTSEQSYSNNYSESLFRQTWVAIRIIEDFFSDKGNDFVDSCIRSRIISISQQMKIVSDTSYNEDLYIFLLNELDKIDKSYWKYVPIHNRAVFVIRKREYVSLYCKVLICIKRLLMRH